MRKVTDITANVSIYLDGAPRDIVKSRMELLQILPDEPNSTEFCEHFGYDTRDIGRHTPARYPTHIIQLTEDDPNLTEPIFIFQQDIGRENLWYWYVFAYEHNLTPYWMVQREGDAITYPLYRTNDLHARYFKDNLWATFNSFSPTVREILREEYKTKHEETYCGRVNDFFVILTGHKGKPYEKLLDSAGIRSSDFRIARIKRVDNSRTAGWFRERAEIFNSLRTALGLDFSEARFLRKYAYAGPAYRIEKLRNSISTYGIKKTAQIIHLGHI